MKLLKLNTDDIFISYRRSNATTYADGLANELTKKGFSCFTDAMGTDADKELPDSLIQKLKPCRMLVVVGSPDAALSKAVAEEILQFSSQKGTSPITVIDFNNSVDKASWERFVTGKRHEKEDIAALQSGNPSQAIVSGIEKAFAYRKSKDRLKLYTRSAIALLSVLVLAIGVASFIAADQIKKAEQALNKAVEAGEQAKQASLRAVTASNLAKEKTNLAMAAIKRADSLNLAYEKRKAELQKYYTVRINTLNNDIEYKVRTLSILETEEKEASAFMRDVYAPKFLETYIGTIEKQQFFKEFTKDDTAYVYLLKDLKDYSTASFNELFNRRLRMTNDIFLKAEKFRERDRSKNKELNFRNISRAIDKLIRRKS